MREPPALGDDAIVGAVEASFGIRVTALAFLPVGNDAASWAYRVQAARGQAFFLKVRAGADRAPGAVVPWHLQRLGVPHVLAPLASGTGAPTVRVGGIADGLVRPGDTDRFFQGTAGWRSTHACSPTTAPPGRSRTSPPTASRS